MFFFCSKYVTSHDQNFTPLIRQTISDSVQFVFHFFFRPFLSEVFYSLNCKMTKCILPSIDASGHKSKSGSKSSSSNEEVNDQNCLLSVILLLAMFNNPTCDQNVLEKIYLPTQRVKVSQNLFSF